MKNVYKVLPLFLSAALLCGADASSQSDVQPTNDGPFTGRVALIEPLGVETLLYIKSGEQTLVSTVPGITRIQLGSDLRFDIVRERLHFFDSAGERVN